MKKTIISVLTASLILGTSTIALAADNTSVSSTNNSTSVTQTAGQTSAKKQFYSTVYKDKMAVITDLRTQTKNTLASNKTVSDKIKSAMKLINTSSDLQTQVKSGKEKLQNDSAELKNLVQQRNTLRSQLETAKKDKDTSTISSLKSQIKSLSSQIETAKQQYQTDKLTVQPLTTQLKNANNARKQKLQQLQPLIQQNKDLHQKIVQEEAAKNKLWESYKAQVKSGDFTSAGNTLQSIIDAKTQILNDIKTKGDTLNQLLSSINSLNGSQQ